MRYKLFLSHDHRDEALAQVIAKTISRITLGQLEVWFSSDASASGGIQPGKVWLDEIRTQLEQSKAILVLLTPLSNMRPWILFESGFGAANPNCEVIPICIGISPNRDVPFPLAMYQCYQLADYESLKKFTSKLLQRHGINFDEEMAKPVLQKAITEFTVATLPNDRPEATQIEINLSDISEEIKQHIDRRFIELAERQEMLGIQANDKDQAVIIRKQNVPSVAYSIPIMINFPGFSRKQYLSINNSMTVQDVLDNIYFMLQDKVKSFTYLRDWILIDSKTGINLVIREVTNMIPANIIFTPTSIWVAVKLKKPYSPDDSADVDRWYRFSG